MDLHSHVFLIVIFLLSEVAESEVTTPDCARGLAPKDYKQHDIRNKDTEITDSIRLEGSKILAALRTDSVKNLNVDVKLGPLSEFDQKSFDLNLMRDVTSYNSRRRDSLNNKDEKRRGRGRCGGDKVCRRIRRQQRKKWREMKKSRLSWEAFQTLEANEEKTSKHAETYLNTPKNKHSWKTRKAGNKTSIVDVLKSNKNPIIIAKANNFKPDWCLTLNLKQTVTEVGCRPKYIMNNFCYGQCNSIYIPLFGSSDSDKINNTFQSCAFCKPLKTVWVNVTLRCPKLVPPTRTKRVKRIQKCRCQSEKLR